MNAARTRSPRVTTIEGRSGVTVLHQNNATSRSFCVGVWINTGSQDEAPGEAGLSHFFEHMIFKGTKRRSAFEISRAIEKVGGSLDAFTTKEQICIYAQVLEGQRDLATDVLSDMLRNPTFPPDQVLLERQVVLEEISDVMDAPDDLVHELFASEVFPGHALGRPILGTPQTVSSFTRETLRRFATRHVKAPNVVVAVYGNIQRKRLIELADSAFQLRDGSVRHSRKRLGAFAPARRQFKRRLHHQHIVIGGPGCSYLDDRRYALLVLTTLLGGGMSSRLFQRIREEMGLAYAIFTYADSTANAGLVGTYLSVKPQNTRVAIREVFREFDRIRRGGVKPSELADNKEQLKGRILLGLETSASRMMRMARNHIYYGRQISDRELIDRIDKVTMDDVMAVADPILDPDRNTVVSLGPSSAGLRS